jgi:hypothetical protein
MRCILKINCLRFIIFFITIANIQALSASSLVAGLANFSGSETVITFNTIDNTQPVNNQYAGLGVAFNGSLVGLTNSLDPSLFNGSAIASNWNYDDAVPNTGSTWTATFSSVQSQVGFFAESNEDDDITIEGFLKGSSVGSVNFSNPNGTTPDFLGIQNLLGIDSITVTTASNFNGFFGMDDFRFESNTAVPVPAAIWLFGSGLFAVMGMRKKRHPI